MDRDGGRMRVTRACDRCKRRKIRCTGLQPCEQCIRTKSSCTFNASYNRGSRPRIIQNNSAYSNREALGVAIPANDHDASLNSPNGLDGSEQPSAHSTDDSGMLASGSDQAGAVESRDPISRNSPEPFQTDLQGHYVGAASGVSFLLRVQKRLHQSAHFSNASSTIFTFGDMPLPEFDPGFCFMPSKEESARLLQKYFDFTVPVDRFLHQPTVERWLEEFHETVGAMRNKDEAPAQRALLFMIFALSQDLDHSKKPNTANSDLSVHYFLLADNQLSKERGSARLTSVQARLCQCLWLLSQSRINHCWTLFGTTAHLVTALGLNRSKHADPAAGYNYIELECRRRSFWCAYCLGNYLSTALGRPRTFHDDDIDQELPTCIDDKDIHFDHIAPNINQKQTLMFAPVAYHKLSRIVSMILRDLYSIHPLPSADRYAYASKYSQKLHEWRSEMSDFLDVEINTSFLIPIFQRQRNVLNLSYWHTIILTHRPFFLTSFARLQQTNRRGSSNLHETQTEDSVRQCLQAAMSITNVVNEMVTAGKMFQAYWFTTYFAFSAVVVLYVYAIRQTASPFETYHAYLNAAIRCQNQISRIAEKGSLAWRYCLVLEELRKEACRQVEVPKSPPASGQEISFTNTTTLNAQDFVASHVNGDFTAFDLSPNSLTDLSNWGQFDATVTPDFGGLETLLTFDNM